jgi:hypothetical protein
MAQNLHRTAKGKLIDMNKLMNQHELEVAVSNVKINARGDELGPGGNIIRNINQLDDIGVSSTPVHFHSTPTPVAVVKTAAPIVEKPVFEAPKPVVDSPNARIQPAVDTQDVNKSFNHKGKQ